MSQPRIYIGTSGWNYRDWRGRFYPQGLKSIDWLGYLAQHFPSTEINYSFYCILPAGWVKRWVSQAPRDFRFAVKLWRGITQFRKLKNCREFLEIFFGALADLPSTSRAPLLVQLPPQLRRDVGRLDAFLDELREVTAPARWKVAVEFRHDEWLCDDVYRMLDRQRAAICLHDMRGRGAATEANDVGFVYIRRHGTTAKYAGSYSDAQLAHDAKRIQRWHDEGRTVYEYFNNDREGHAVENARDLRRKLGV